MLFRSDDSPFYAVEARVADFGVRREAWETLAAWLERLGAHPAAPRSLELATLRHLVALHARYRFDPRGLDRARQDELRTLAAGWLARHPAPEAG